MQLLNSNACGENWKQRESCEGKESQQQNIYSGGSVAQQFLSIKIRCWMNVIIESYFYESLTKNTTCSISIMRFIKEAYYYIKQDLGLKCSAWKRLWS